MAFDINKYFKTKGKNVQKDIASLTEAANALEKAAGYSNNESYKGWANSALAQIKDYNDIIAGKRSAKDNHGNDLAKKALDNAFAWLTGAKQPSRASSVWSGYDSVSKQITSKLATLLSNKANVADIPETASASERAALEKKAADIQKQIDQYGASAEKLGLPMPGITKTASGFVPTSEYQQPTPTTPSTTNSPPGTTTEQITASQIPFKAGLSDAQKASIQQLATKPASQWNDTDKANWNYATNNAPPPLTNSATSPAPAAPPTGTPSPTTSPTPTATPTQNLAGTSAPSGAGSNLNIPFKDGLSEAQKSSIEKLLSKPQEQWTDTDRANWGYATNNSPIPQAGAGGVLGAPLPDDMVANLKALGLSDETINSLPPDQRGIFASIGAVMQKQIDNGNPLPQTFTTDDLARFADQAAKDPTIDKYYKDQLRLGVADLNAKMGFLTGETQAAFQQLQQQFPQQNIEAAKAAAAAGQAYSGFRNQAKERLKQNQQAVLSSTTRQAQQNLRNLGTNFEQNYGTANLPQGGLRIAGVPSPIAYNAFGNVPGQLEQQKQLDIANKNQSLIQDASLIRGL